MNNIICDDFRSFEILFDRYWFDLYRYCVKVLENEAEAEDAVQEVFCDLWENRKRIVIEISLEAFLFGCLRKKILKRFRDKGVKEKHLLIFKTELQEVSNYTLSSIISDDLLAVLRSQLEVLPRKEKEVFILSQLDGFSVKEIAEKFSTSEQTVRNQINNAFQKMDSVLTKLLR